MLALIFLSGLIVGSFLNVLIYRLPQGEGVAVSRSYCPKCKTKLAALDLVPVLSYLLLRGRCRYCNTKVSRQYPLVELVTGGLVVGLFQQYHLSSQFMTYSLLVALLIVASVIDFKLMIIPNKITYLGIISGLLASVVFNHISVRASLLGLLIPAGLLLIIALVGGMGLGDVKLVAMIGSFIGLRDTLVGIFFGSLIGSILGVGLISLGIKNRKSRIPFGPFIAIGTILVLLFREPIINFYFQLY
ncbi:prepilin signal peptidase PulO-like peptidase [Halobacteroides halobius DSM 5150]|uniref:Prepilin signal peptidase PulO-like peptidase n=1 Tax=Halobacteroides halobius (strain ATCC 35273 / DSM 5150 / MD-1) TaxID=748449 RepID=L0KCC0_HALHC|nr:A24 family peptidase [Halobacteroides halobius]AGB41723.1 prepilin signal peptidase PulO-like peptidase [Halobacteroides halobius DSM 5150]